MSPMFYAWMCLLMLVISASTARHYSSNKTGIYVTSWILLFRPNRWHLYRPPGYNILFNLSSVRSLSHPSNECSTNITTKMRRTIRNIEGAFFFFIFFPFFLCTLFILHSMTSFLPHLKGQSHFFFLCIQHLQICWL